MSLTPAVLDAMVKAGCTAEQIVAAVKASMGEVEARTEEKRTRDRERKRRQRTREREGHEVSRGQSVTAADIDAPPSPPPPSLSPTPPNLTPTPTPPEHTPRARKADPFPCPEWCDEQVWRDLKANRRTKRLANTNTAHQRFIDTIEAMADDHWPPGKLVEAIAARGWGGPIDPRTDRKPSGAGPSPGSKQRGGSLADIGNEVRELYAQ